MFGVRFVIP